MGLKILIGQSLFRPHMNGMTSYAYRLAKGLVRRGHQVSVLTSQHQRDLPHVETLDGIEVIRVPVWAQIGKVPVAPGILYEGLRQIARADVVNLHLPHESTLVYSLLARLMPHKPMVLTYHCDLTLPRGLLNSTFNRAASFSSSVAASGAHAIVHATEDYARGSAFLTRWQEKICFIPPPAEVAPVNGARREALRKRLNPEGKKTIGFIGRFAHEKGILRLLEAVGLLASRLPDSQLLIVGPTSEVLGESLWNMLKGPMDALGERLRIVGMLPDEDMGNFYSLCDVVVSPSDNPSESFGLTQVEAMTSGVPVVVSDIRGMRVPVSKTGMGRIAPLGDACLLADAIYDVLSSPRDYRSESVEAQRHFGLDRVVEDYESLFLKVASEAALAPSPARAAILPQSNGS